MKPVVRMKNSVVVVHTVQEHVLILLHRKKSAIICVRSVVFVLLVISVNMIRKVPVSKKLNVKIPKDIVTFYIFISMGTKLFLKM